MSKHYELSVVIQLPLQIKTQDTEALLGSANQEGEKGSAGSSDRKVGGEWGGWGTVKCMENNLALVAGCHQAPVRPCIRLYSVCAEYWGVS